MKRTGKFSQMEYPTVPKPLYTSAIIFILREEQIESKFRIIFIMMQCSGYALVFKAESAP